MTSRLIGNDLAMLIVEMVVKGAGRGFEKLDLTHQVEKCSTLQSQTNLGTCAFVSGPGSL